MESYWIYVPLLQVSWLRWSSIVITDGYKQMLTGAQRLPPWTTIICNKWKFIRFETAVASKFKYAKPSLCGMRQAVCIDNYMTHWIDTYLIQDISPRSHDKLDRISIHVIYTKMAHFIVIIHVATNRKYYMKCTFLLFFLSWKCSEELPKRLNYGTGTVVWWVWAQKRTAKRHKKFFFKISCQLIDNFTGFIMSNLSMH